MVDINVRFEIEDLLHREAHFLDSHQYDKWLDMLTDDIVYYMPLTEYVEGESPPAGHAIMNETKAMLEFRVANEATGYSHVETPRSMTCHLISNILIEEIDDSDELRVLSSFLVRQTRKLRGESLWAGRRTDVVRPVDGSWKIARRDIELQAAILPRGVSIFF